ncbi:Protein SMG7 [Vitis vinifera]|uniref:Protein SMG7 n=1 Tax=Vitis vinifera TaxID=29760 RepID=A0A438KFR9_VITVI|nr:Protein SMG7 [Vitis vinifera]
MSAPSSRELAQRLYDKLHYRRIEELRAHFSAALASSGSATSQSAKGPLRPDRVAKIRFRESNVMEKDVKKSTEMKKGLISCHRCLIYLGDLARYKGLYGEGDSKTRDYAAASSYYLQAASLWPSSGNPHHQLAILLPILVMSWWLCTGTFGVWL